jgi:hypothetical protein
MDLDLTDNYLKIILLHIVLGILIFLVPVFSILFSFSIFIVGFIYVIKTQNRNNEVLLVCGYIVGAEVLLRSTGGDFFYEFAKYGVALFVFIGMIYSGFSKNAIPYWLFLALLIPGILIGVFSLNGQLEIRRSISNTISGPFCLGLVSLYTYQRKIHINNINNILLAIGLPIISHLVYLIFFNPSVKDVISGTDSNGATSGGFGPNQVSTIIGLGIFIFVNRLILKSKNNFLILLNFIIAIVLSFRGVVTFSRGGIFTGIIMLCALIFNLYFLSKNNSRWKLNILVVISITASMGIWIYSIAQTNGLIQKRYNNQDSLGRVKESKLSGREDLMKSEIRIFFDNPILGVGVGKSIEIRQEETGLTAASHNEITRLLAEHGAIGIIILLILIFTPIFLFFDNKQNIFMFPFLLFWLLTINHAAMRIAAPAFVYGLSLLKVYIKEPLKFQNQV